MTSLLSSCWLVCFFSHISLINFLSHDSFSYETSSSCYSYFRKRFVFWRRTFARDVRIRWDQSWQLPTFKHFTLYQYGLISWTGYRKAEWNDPERTRAKAFWRRERHSLHQATLILLHVFNNKSCLYTGPSLSRKIGILFNRFWVHKIQKVFRLSNLD